VANKVISVVIDTADDDLHHALAPLVDELHKSGHVVRQVRIMDDSGETVIPVNTIAGVTVPEPVVPEEPQPEPEEEAPQPEVEPAPEPEPEPEPTPEPDAVPEDTPVDPTVVTAPVDPTPEATA
jgi:outer membrane biosynthesis protein TonB